MTKDTLRKSTASLPQDAFGHSRDLLLALSRAAQSTQRAHTVEEVYQAVGRQIKFLGGDVSLLIVEEDPGQLVIAYTSYELSFLQRAEKFLGFSALGYRFAVSPDGVFARSMADGKTTYVESTKEYTAAMLPKSLRLMVEQVMRILKVKQGIFAPLCMDAEKLGVMVFTGSFLTEDDVPVMESFAAQIAVSLHNVRLTQQMQNELSTRKQMEEKLRQSEERYRSLFDNMMDGIYRSTHAGKFVDVNAAMIKMFGYSSREEMLAVDIKKELYFSPEERGSHILDTGQEEIEVYRMRRKDGSEIWVEDHGHYVHDEQGNILYHEGMLRDVTVRKKAEDNVLLQNAALEAAANAIAITDITGRLQWVNRAWVALTGYSKEESIGRNVRIIKSGKHDQTFYKKMWDTILRGKVWRGELVNRRKDGSLYDEEETITPVLDNQGNVTHFIAIKLDITERKRAEANLELLARTDALTGINNRRHLFELAVHEFEVARRYGHPLSVIMLDLDHFKDVNDTFGHAVGDQILQNVTQVARSQLRDVDLIGRYGGEEFVIILPVTSARQASLVAERIRGGVENLRIETDKGPASVTLSLGIAEMFHAPQDGSVDDMIRRADEALYAAKKAGRNCIAIFEAG
ncbi:putative diguanylate cyclase DgcC [Anaerolineales bacterium]|nr:putative diguanylate cyclase DgcC [Anaerolineales bacterium]